MKSLYITKYPIFGNDTMDKRIGIVDNQGDRAWTCGLVPPEDFIVKSYEFDKLTFIVDYIDLDIIAGWNIDNTKVVVVVIGTSADEQVDTLYSLGTDIYLNIEVQFVDTLNDYLYF